MNVDVNQQPAEANSPSSSPPPAAIYEPALSPLPPGTPYSAASPLYSPYSPDPSSPDPTLHLRSTASLPSRSASVAASLLLPARGGEAPRSWVYTPDGAEEQNNREKTTATGGGGGGAGGGNAFTSALSGVRSRLRFSDSSSLPSSSSSASLSKNLSSRTPPRGIVIFVCLFLLAVFVYYSSGGHLETSSSSSSSSSSAVDLTNMNPEDRRLWRLQQIELEKQRQGLPSDLDERKPQPANTLLLGDALSKDLNPEPLLCKIPMELRKKCSWARSPSSDPTSLFAFQAGQKLLPDTNGIIVRIFYKDQCCRVSSSDPVSIPPLAYFRVYVSGSLLTTSNPLLSVGGAPLHTRTHVPVVGGWKSQPVVLPDGVDEGRVTQAVLPLSESGVIELRVELHAYDQPRDLITRFYWNDKPDPQQPDQGTWLIKQPGESTSLKNGGPYSSPLQPLVRTLQGETSRKFVLPLCDGLWAKSTDDWLRKSLKPCGSFSRDMHPEDNGLVSGRWKFDPRNQSFHTLDLTSLSDSFLLEHSTWVPHYCALYGTEQFNAYAGAEPSESSGSKKMKKKKKELQSKEKSHPHSSTSHKLSDKEFSSPSETIQDILSQHKWVHFIGDDRVASSFESMCATAAPYSRLYKIPPTLAPTTFDKPSLCYGFSSQKNQEEENFKEVVWVLTYEKWVLTQPLAAIPLREFPHISGDKSHPESFYFNSACARYSPDGGGTGDYKGGWPSCDRAPKNIQEMEGPTATFMGFGRRHLSRFGGMGGVASTSLVEKQKNMTYKEIKQILEHAFFRRYPTLFLLSPPVADKRLAAPHYPQGSLALSRLNNIRIYGFNDLLVELIREYTHSRVEKEKAFATRSTEGFRQGHGWLPVVDLFSPAYAALDAMLSVHATPSPDALGSASIEVPFPHNFHVNRKYEETEMKILTHYLVMCPNIQGKHHQTEKKQQQQQQQHEAKEKKDHKENEHKKDEKPQSPSSLSKQSKPSSSSSSHSPTDSNNKHSSQSNNHKKGPTHEEHKAMLERERKEKKAKAKRDFEKEEEKKAAAAAANKKEKQTQHQQTDSNSKEKKPIITHEQHKANLERERKEKKAQAEREAMMNKGKNGKGGAESNNQEVKHMMHTLSVLSQPSPSSPSSSSSSPSASPSRPSPPPSSAPSSSSPPRPPVAHLTHEQHRAELLKKDRAERAEKAEKKRRESINKQKMEKKKKKEKEQKKTKTNAPSHPSPPPPPPPASAQRKKL